MSAPDEPRPSPPDVAAAIAAARRETVRYHEELYASTPLGAEGTWLARPHPVVVEALDLARGAGPVVAYDLGAGVGRHAVPLAAGLAPGSRVVAVDLLPTAVDRLRRNCDAAGVGAVVKPVTADLESYAFDEGAAGLIVAFSAIEHVGGVEALRALLGRMVAATAPGGLHVLGILADRREVLADGTVRPAAVESPLSSAATLDLLDDAYAGWEVLRRSTKPSVVREERDGVTYGLSSTLVHLLARRPG